MTLREALNGGDADIKRRLDQILDSEDAVVVLADRRGFTSYVHGYGISGCQREMLGHDVESVIRISGGIPPTPRVDCHR